MNIVYVYILTKEILHYIICHNALLNCLAMANHSASCLDLFYLCIFNFLRLYFNYSIYAVFSSHRALRYILPHTPSNQCPPFCHQLLLHAGKFPLHVLCCSQSSFLNEAAWEPKLTASKLLTELSTAKNTTVS